MSGAPWVLLRGLSRCAGHWGDVPRRLAAATGRPVHCIDLPGNGEALALRSPLDVAAMARHVRSQLPAHGVTGPVYVVGLSMGGMVACEWARSAPTEVAGLVLVNSSLRGISPWYHRLRPQAWPALLRLLLPLSSPLQWEQTIFALTSNRPALREATLPGWLALREAAPVTRDNALRQLWAAARYAAPHGAPPVPRLVIAGLGDRLVHPRCSRALASAWSAALAVHPTAGHDLPLDEPDWLVRTLADWEPPSAQPQPQPPLRFGANPSARSSSITRST